MTEHFRPTGRTTIAPEVLTTIARMAALSVPGVQAMAHGVNRLFQRGPENGVQIAVRDNLVVADLFIVVKEEVNIREVGRNVQQQVTRAIQEMTGMEVGQVDIHIEDIHYEGSEA